MIESIFSADIVARTDNWVVIADDQSKVVFPEGRDGKRLRVLIPKFALVFRHRQTGHVVVFSTNKSVGRWHWHDSRDKKPVSRREVIREVARLLYGNDTHQAERLVSQHLGA